MTILRYAEVLGAITMPVWTQNTCKNQDSSAGFPCHFLRKNASSYLRAISTHLRARHEMGGHVWEKLVGIRPL